MQTRSASKHSEMSVSNEIKEYFSELLEPLATNESIQTMFSEFKEKVLAKVTAQAERIDELEPLVSVKDTDMKKLIESSNNNEKLLHRLSIKCDDNEQYSRRSCVRIHGIEFNEGKAKDENVNEIVKRCYETMGMSFNENSIDRAHRIGKPYTDKESGKTIRSIIVKFKAWADRTSFYKNRPKRFINGKKKPGSTPFSVSLDITKRRYELLKRALGIVDQYYDVKYAFCDINCSLGIKLTNDKLLFFNDNEQLEDHLFDLR